MANKQLKHNVISTPKLWWLLIGASLITAIAIRRNFELTSPAIAPTKNTTETGSWKKIVESTAIFYSKIFLQRNKTFVYIPLKFEGETQAAWLSLDSSSSAEPTSWLISHPTLEKLDWPSLNEQSVYLYQKNKKYNDMASFIKDPPQKDRVMIEQALRAYTPYSTLQAIDLTDAFNPDNVDYIITTYKKSPIKDGALYYENIVDATNGNLNSNNKLMWFVNVPTATKEQPFYIGEIHVDYR